MSLDGRLIEGHQAKVIFIGDSGTGKTSIINMKCCDRFDSSLAPTIGSSSLSLTTTVDSANVLLKLWDTAGQEQFSSLVPMYARDSQVAVLVADISNWSTIERLTSWEAMLMAAGERPAIIAAVNKTDMVEKYAKPIPELHRELSEHFSKIAFVSALTGEGIDDLFSLIAREAVCTLSAEHEAENKLVRNDNGKSCCS